MGVPLVSADNETATGAGVQARAEVWAGLWAAPGVETGIWAALWAGTVTVAMAETGTEARIWAGIQAGAEPWIGTGLMNISHLACAA